MLQTLEQMLPLLEQGQAVALSLALERSGSAPTPAGATLLVSADRVAGTLGGGQMEAGMVRLSREALASGRASLSRFNFDSDTVQPGGMLCGGRIAFYTFVVRPTPEALGFWSAVLNSARKGERVWLLLAVSEGEAAGWAGVSALVEDGAVKAGSLTETTWETAVLRALEGRSAEQDTLFLTLETPSTAWPGLAGFLARPLVSPPRLLVLGGGHVGLALCRVAALAGFRVTVVDDRPEFATIQRFPEAEQVLNATFAEAFSSLTPGPGWSVVAVARSHDQDREAVELALACPVDYVGMIGSRRKVALLREHLAARGVDSARLAGLHAPVGLDIGAETPGEIAVSIAAQLIQVRRSRKPVLVKEIITL
ncbi:XdhC family protein [bacterium]|nr:XdhC family protein [bacterium]